MTEWGCSKLIAESFFQAYHNHPNLKLLSCGRRMAKVTMLSSPQVIAKGIRCHVRTWTRKARHYCSVYRSRRHDRVDFCRRSGKEIDQTSILNVVQFIELHSKSKHSIQPSCSFNKRQQS